MGMQTFPYMVCFPCSLVMQESVLGFAGQGAAYELRQQRTDNHSGETGEQAGKLGWHQRIFITEEQ
jgi:hypothetical protein